MKLQRISIELAVFLMITLVAFGGFASLSVDDGSGNDLTGDWKKPKWVKQVQKAVSKPFVQIKEEAKRVETKAMTSLIKAASAPIRQPEQFAKSAQDVKKATEIMATATTIAAGLGMMQPGQQKPSEQGQSIAGGPQYPGTAISDWYKATGQEPNVKPSAQTQSGGSAPVALRGKDGWYDIMQDEKTLKGLT